MCYEAMRASMLEKKPVCIISIAGVMDVKDLPEEIRRHLSRRHFLPDVYTHRLPADTIRCAQDILQAVLDSNLPALKKKDRGKLQWRDEDLRYGLPATPNVFDYEKDMIHFFIAKQCYEAINQGLSPESAALLRERHRASLGEWSEERIKKVLAQGVVADWPAVPRYSAQKDNPLRQDAFRNDKESLVRAAALMGLDSPRSDLCFPEAGPRPKVALPVRKNLRVAIIVAGGIAPGINAVIDAIVQRHDAYRRASNNAYELKVIGLKNGLLAIEKDREFSIHTRQLEPNDTREYATRGGSMLGTSRDKQLLDSHAPHAS
jgi:hypothetical protein